MLIREAMEKARKSVEGRSSGLMIRVGTLCLVCVFQVLGQSPQTPSTPAQKPSVYGLTTILRLAPPFRIEDMNDDYQEARILEQDKDSAKVEVVHHPLAVLRAIRENPDWKRDDAGMTEYLRPTPTENWDEQMRKDLLAELKKDGIHPDRLTDLQVVTQVSKWAKARSQFIRPFTSFFVHFPKGVPEVYAPLRKAFDKEKPSAETTDQKMFENEVLGRQMFYNRVHGACTSYAVYQATILRALGIPTRIVICVPPVDTNDASQKELLLKSIHHNAVRATIRHGLPRTGSKGNGTFSDHMFNEVYVGKHWVRLNYETVGQSPLDPHYMGLMTHILTANSLSEIPLAETWGMRFAELVPESPAFSSMNPYRLLNVTEQLAADIPNPEVEDELKTVHVTQAYWKSSLSQNPELSKVAQWDTHSDFYLGIQEIIPDYTYQMSDFASHASTRFLLSAPGRPDIHACLSGYTSYNSSPGHRYALFGMSIEKADRPLFTPGVDYAIQPVENRETYTWVVDPVLRIRGTLADQMELNLVTVIGIYWRGAIPVDGINKTFEEHERRSDFFIRVRTPEPCTGGQLKKFCESTKTRFVLSAPGKPDLQVFQTRSMVVSNSPQDGAWPVLGLALEPGCRVLMVAGVDYSLRPLNTSEKQKWEVMAGLVLQGRELKP